MDMVNDLGNDLVLSTLINKANEKKIDSKEILPLMSKIREILEPISERDHSTSAFSYDVIDDQKTNLIKEATISH